MEKSEGEEGRDQTLSVVVPVRNGRDELARCVAALLRQTVPIEVVIVDDGSSDGSGDLARGFGAKVITQPPLGRAAARNHGTRAATGTIILFTDSDCQPELDWAAKLAAPLQGEGADGAVGRITSGQQHRIARLIQLELETRYARMERNTKIDFANTGNCGFRRGLLLRHPFNEKLPWLEDIELSFRLGEAGACLLFIPEARVEHLHPETFAGYFRRKYRYAMVSPVIYRSFPGKALSDSGNPFTRRLQLLFFCLSFPASFWSPLLGMIILASSVFLSAPLISKALRESLKLGVIAVPFVLIGTAGTTAGFVRGLFPRRKKSAPRKQVSV